MKATEEERVNYGYEADEDGEAFVDSKVYTTQLSSEEEIVPFIERHRGRLLIPLRLSEDVYIEYKGRKISGFAHKLSDGHFELIFSYKIPPSLYEQIKSAVMRQ